MPASQNPAVAADRTSQPGALSGMRVVELADEQAEYCGLTLAGLGADVVKVEPPGGSPTRRIGPFYQDREDPERSLFFWQYNRGKRSIVLDLQPGEQTGSGSASLVATADVLLESTPKGELDGLGLGADALMQQFPALIVARVSRRSATTVPWADFKGSDLVHLALGGVMMNCGYDPGSRRHVRPAADRAADVARLSTSPASSSRMAIVAALLFRWRTGKGQHLSCAIHEAVAKSTEVDLMSWVMRRVARPAPDLPPRARSDLAASVHRAHQGRALGDGESRQRARATAQRLVALLERYGMDAGLDAEKAAAPPGRTVRPGHRPEHGEARPRHGGRAALRARVHLRERAVARGAGGGHALGAAAQAARERHRPALARARSCTDVEHPELGRSFRYATSKWLGTAHVLVGRAGARRC